MKKHAKKIIVLLLAVAMLVPTVAMIFGSAAESYPVELAFNNLFIFEEWASNENSTTVVYGGATKVGELTPNINDGSFTLKKTSTDVPQVYNGHGESKTNSVSNTDYYSMSVEPNTAYSFSYNLNSITNSGSITPYLFLFDSSFLCKVIYQAPTASTGANSFMFITPPDITHIQFRFTLDKEGGTSEAKINNISLTKRDVVLDSANLFDFASWANTNSGKTVGFNDGALYANGKIDRNEGDKSMTVTRYAGEEALFSGFSLTTTEGYYMIPAKANTCYVLNYNIVNSMSSNYEDVTPYLVRVNTAGDIDYIGGCSASGYGKSSCAFTTKSDTAYISVVFAFGNSSATDWIISVRDIEVLEATEVTGPAAVTPGRVVKSYGTDETYDELPTPSETPENHVFAGWYTGENGEGMRIAADTPVQPMSFTVYPKFEPAVNTLTVKTQPERTVYTVGEKLDTTGLVLEATITSDGLTNTFDINSGYYCTPEILNTAGTQTITAHYGGKTATFTVTVKESDPGTVIVNGVSMNVAIANNEYTFNISPSEFNRYEVTYKSDSYVSGVATFNNGKTEEFFLEPSDNGSFGSYVDKFINNNYYNQLVKIKFTTLDKENGQFELYSLKTVKVAVPDATIYFDNNKYEMGVSLEYGGVVSELYDLKKDVYARTYSNGSNDITLVDYKEKLVSGHKAESQRVNLINTLDRGRYLQQSYYGTGDKPYIQSEYNNAAWPYNPVQGGNVIGEASKIIDYKVTNDYVYVKARPLDWAKWSDEYAATDARYEAVWGDDYITDTYVESWYYFQDNTIKVTNRKVDYSGLPEASHSQEFPALYLIEPLNHFVYNNVSAQDAWKTEAADLYNNSQFIDYTDATRSTHWSKPHNEGVLVNYEEPEYWGLTQMYKDKFGMENFEPWVNVNENWAAFTASEDQDSFGVGLYTDATTKFYYGVQPTMYQQKAGSTEGSVGEVLDTPEYRHAQTINPSPELPTSYIAPTDTAIFRSYEPTEFTYYLATGTASEIREEFRSISKASEERAKPKIAVPETVYLRPNTNGQYTDGQYYATNVLNPNNYYSIETKAEYTDMYLGVYAQGGTNISVSVSNVTNPNENIDVRASDGSASYDGIIFKFTEDTDPNEGTFIFPAGLDLDFVSGGLEPGEKATARWDIVVYYGDPSNPATPKEAFVAYTVMYAPHRTVGAVAEARQVNASQNEVSSWITGANGVDHSQRAPLGTFHGDVHDSGYFREDPLVYGDTPPSGYNPGGGNSHDYIISSDESSLQDGGVNQTDDYSENAYVLQTATDDHDSSRAQSYLGLLAIDKSRYTNTDQIPNLRIGYDVLRIGSYKKDSLGKYSTYYTVGDELAYTASSLSAAPSGWTTFTSYTDHFDPDKNNPMPYRESFVPSYKVAGLDGKYLHAIAQGTANQTINPNQYSTAGTSVLISLTDKSELRESVTDGYGVKDPDDEFLEKLEEAATILGDPSASQEDIDRIMDDIDDYLDIFYALKYDNLFGTYEMSKHPNSMNVVGNKGTATYNDGKITIVNGTITGGEAYTEYGSADHYYKVQLKPNTEYVFEYDVTTDVKSQAFMFFYNANGSNSEPPTNLSVQTNGGSWQSKTESNSWFGNYGNAGTYHYVIKFTTGATTTQASFRFGNTTNDPCESTFSNIRLIDSERYYADAEYETFEDVYKEYAYYGTLQTPVRNGYDFGGWYDAENNEVTAIDNATEHKSIFSKWTIHNYTITYNANGGSVSPTSQNYTINDSITLPTPTRDGHTFQGWKVTAADGSWEIDGVSPAGPVPAGMYGNVMLTAQWVLGEIPVYFDTILDFSEWDTKTASNATISGVTPNGFTLTSNADAGEGTSTSPEFPVTPGKQYYIDIEVADSAATPHWDVYIFFYDKNTHSGLGLEFNDGTNRFSANGQGVASRTFTAPANSDHAVIRLDANGSSHSVTFSDIRVYEAGTRAANVNVPYSNKTVKYDDLFGELPVPTREGYTFKGWYDENNLKVTAEKIVAYTSAVYLKSKWVISDEALAKDTVVIDFSTPIDITPLANDTVYASAEGEKTFLGFSADGTNHGATTINGNYGTFAVNGQTVTYTPTKAVDGVETIYYHASVKADGVTTNIKNEINVVPASNVLYEETFFVGNEALSGEAWGDVGTKLTANQSPSPETDEKYGYDKNTAGYNQFKNYSNGTAKTVTVSNSKKMSKNTTFTFKGTGFDLNSACGANTGVMVVSLKNNTTNKMVKSYVVDTYYGDAGYGDAQSSNTLYQVPIISETGLDHADYTVQVVASYLPTMSGAIKADKAKEAEEQQKLQQASVNGIDVTIASGADNEALRNALAELGLDYIFDAEEVEVVWFDDNSVLNGGMGADTPIAGDKLETASLDSLVNVIDSVRVYKPLTSDTSNSHYINSEKNAAYYNVIDNLVDTTNGSLTGTSFFAYITGKLGDGIQLSIDNYESVGPKNELYLSESTSAVAFTIKNYDTIKSTDGRIMISLRAASGTPKLKIDGKNFYVNSNTEMYYDITDYITNGTVTIQNSADSDTDKSLLAIGSLKITCRTSAVMASISSEVDLETVKAMMMAPSVTVEPNTTPTPEEPEVPEEPEDPNEPEIPEEPEEPAEESWLIRIFKWIFNTVIKIFSALKGFLAI